MKVTNNNMPDDLLAKYLTGTTVPSENLQAEEWINTNEANRLYYEQLKSISDVSSQSDANHNEEAWIRLQNLISKHHDAHADKPAHKFNARWVQLIITILLIGAMSYFIRTRLYSNVMLNIKSGAKVAHNNLPDGSWVTLNTHSQIAYPARFTGNKRQVTLSGEAFIVIAADPLKPFIINLKDIIITTSQASLTLSSFNEQTKIAVVNGTAKLSKGGKKILLHAGEKATGKPGSFVFNVEKNKANALPLWAVSNYPYTF